MSSQPASSTVYQPSVADVVQLKRSLRSKLPAELIDRIIEDASYWPHSSVYFEHPFTVPCENAGDGRMVSDAMYMRTLPLGICGTEGDLRLLPGDFGHDGAACTAALALGGPDDHSWSAPTLLHPCRKIEFQLWSHDQGWGGIPERPGSYSGYSWFDVGIEKSHTPTFAKNIVQWPPYLLFREDLDEEPFHIQRDITTPVIPSDTTLQTNVVAKGETTEHTIMWHFLDSFDKESVEAEEACKVGRGSATVDGKFVRSMQVG
ncbi:hypothetical protein M405DRAFT_883373, partial [Rhizopogon salebrosus TDB-379]